MGAVSGLAIFAVVAILWDSNNTRLCMDGSLEAIDPQEDGVVIKGGEWTRPTQRPQAVHRPEPAPEDED